MTIMCTVVNVKKVINEDTVDILSHTQLIN